MQSRARGGDDLRTNTSDEQQLSLQLRAIRVCDDTESPMEVRNCAGLDDTTEQSNEGGGEGSEGDDASDGEPGSKAVDAIDAPAADEMLWTLSTSCEAVENYMRSVQHLTNFLDLSPRQLFKGVEQCFSLEHDAVRSHKALIRRLIRKVQLEVENANVADAGEAAPEAEAMEVSSDAPEAGAVEATANAGEDAPEAEVMEATSDAGEDAPEAVGAAETADGEARTEVAQAAMESAVGAPLPTSLEELLSAVADLDSYFGRVDSPERAMRTPAIKAYARAGGTRPLRKKEPLPDGFHVLKVRASSVPHPSL